MQGVRLFSSAESLQFTTAPQLAYVCCPMHCKLTTLCLMLTWYIAAQSGCERAHLMAWHSGPLLILLLLEPAGPTASSSSALPVSTSTGGASSSSSSSTCNAAVTASLLELLSGPGHALAGQLAGELPAKHLWHVQGLRYLYQDHLSAAVRWVQSVTCGRKWCTQ